MAESVAPQGVALTTVAPDILDIGLERAADISQILVVLLAVFAAIAAFRQVSTFRLFELTKFLQEDKFQEARRAVIREIYTKKPELWWRDGELEKAASICAGHYEIVGLLLRYNQDRRMTRHFIRNWGVSVRQTYEGVLPFMERRRAEGGNQYRSYEWLYLQALRVSDAPARPFPSAPSPNAE